MQVEKLMLYLLEVNIDYECNESYFITDKVEVVECWQNTMPSGTYRSFKLNQIESKYLPDSLVEKLTVL